MALGLTVGHVGLDAAGDDLAVEGLHQGVQRIIAGDCLLGCGEAGGCECRAVIGRRVTTMVSHCYLRADIVTQMPRECLCQLSRVTLVKQGRVSLGKMEVQVRSTHLAQLEIQSDVVQDAAELKRLEQFGPGLRREL